MQSCHKLWTVDFWFQNHSLWWGCPASRLGSLLPSGVCPPDGRNHLCTTATHTHTHHARLATVAMLSSVNSLIHKNKVPVWGGPSGETIVLEHTGIFSLLFNAEKPDCDATKHHPADHVSKTASPSSYSHEVTGTYFTLIFSSCSVFIS